MWIVTACISPQVNVKGFKKCCTSNIADGNDDDDGTDCEDGDSDADW